MLNLDGSCAKWIKFTVKTNLRKTNLTFNDKRINTKIISNNNIKYITK